MIRDRKNIRVNVQQPGFLIPAPDAPWIECLVLYVRGDGACLEVGNVAVPELFGLALTSGGEVFRACALVWRRGETIGVRFVSARELRDGLEPAAESDPNLRNAAS